MRLFNRDLRLQDVTLVYFTALAALMVILVASYQAPMHAVDVSASAPSGPLPPLPMPFRVPLDPRGELHLAWNISYANQEIYMELRVADLKQGVLLGMSEWGQLTNADLVVLWNTGTRSYFGVRCFLKCKGRFTKAVQLWRDSCEPFAHLCWEAGCLCEEGAYFVIAR